MLHGDQMFEQIFGQAASAPQQSATFTLNDVDELINRCLEKDMGPDNIAQHIQYKLAMPREGDTLSSTESQVFPIIMQRVRQRFGN